MYAIEFETDIDGEYIRIPEFEKLKNKHVRVIVLSEETDVVTASATNLSPQQMQTIVNQARESGISETSLQQMKQQFLALAEPLKKNQYGQYLIKRAEQARKL